MVHNVHNDQEPKGPNMDQLPHVSEEAAAMSKVKGEQGPEVEQQGTPIDEVCCFKPSAGPIDVVMLTSSRLLKATRTWRSIYRKS